MPKGNGLSAEIIVREFLGNILAEMKKVEGIDDLGYYVIKTR